jgi:hypothetical protein
METFLGIQVLSIMFAVFMMYLIFVHYKRRNINQKEYLLWNGAWIVFIVFALLPHVLNPLLTKLSVVRALDLLMIVAFMILTYIMFVDHIAIRDLYRLIGKLTSAITINNAPKNNRKKSVK